MPIRLLLANDHSFGPDDIAVLVTAFESTLSALGLIDRDDPATLMVAKKIIELAKDGERDPARLRDEVISFYRDKPARVIRSLQSQRLTMPAANIPASSAASWGLGFIAADARHRRAGARE